MFANAIRTIVICAALTACVGATRVAGYLDEVIDRVLAVVDGELILQSDVRGARELGLVPVSEPNDADRQVLAALIDRALMLDEVRRYAPPEPMPTEIDRALDDIRARLGSPSALAGALARAGLDEPKLREVLRQDLRIRAYLAQRFNGDDPARVKTAIDDWLAGLRRRGSITDLSAAR